MDMVLPGFFAAATVLYLCSYIGFRRIFAYAFILDLLVTAGFIWMFPMTFISSAFVPTESMPDWLKAIAEANPFTIVTNAARALYNGKPVGNGVWISLAWAVGISVLFAFLSVRKFEKSTSK